VFDVELGDNSALVHGTSTCLGEKARGLSSMWS